MALPTPNKMMAMNAGPTLAPQTTTADPAKTMAKATTGGNAPATQANSSNQNKVSTNPVQLMNWDSKLQQGNTNAQTRTVEGNQTVQQQLNDLTSSNSKYIRNAGIASNAQSAEKGMLMSSTAAGAARRAAIDAALPIAQQDANTYAQTAKDNMDATNADRLADQQMYGNLVGQEVGIRANLDEAERGREFTSQQQDKQNQFNTGEREQSQQWQGSENQLNRDLELAKQTSDQVWQSMEQALTRNSNMTQLDKQLLQERFKIFDSAMQNHQQNLAQTLASIYANTNLKPEQQAAAASNARATYESLMRSYAATMAAGVPEIYWDPYMLQGTSGGGGTTTPPTTPPNTPPGGGVVTSPPNTGGFNSSSGSTSSQPMQPQVVQQPQIQQQPQQPAVAGGSGGILMQQPQVQQPQQQTNTAPWRDPLRFQQGPR